MKHIIITICLFAAMALVGCQQQERPLKTALLAGINYGEILIEQELENCPDATNCPKVNEIEDYIELAERFYSVIDTPFNCESVMLGVELAEKWAIEYGDKQAMWIVAIIKAEVMLECEAENGKE